ncbi:MAG: DUF1800 domain-containing protein [Planctomycetota bacterium]|nr:DUF1800 domain-containing protein [Planctomycetota bacterium]
MKTTAIDPTWAWLPYRASEEQPWNRGRAAHLLRRAGFGATSQEIDAAVEKGPEEIVADLVSPRLDAAFELESDAFAKTILASGDPKNLSAWWSYVMLRTPHPLLEKTTLFWHGHFATSAAKVEDAETMYNQNRLFRQFALGDFGKLTHAISRDPAMLTYLDSITNRKAHPNENYARELMELFCLGEGNYSENDIQELARCFTGWEIRRGKFRFNQFQHDPGMKSVLGHSGPLPEGKSIDVVLDQPAAPQFIVSKLIRYFMFDEPAASDELVEPLANELREHEWDISHVVRRMLTSQLFYSEHVIGRKVRSPVDLVVGLLRTLEGSTNAYQLGDDLNQLGQGLFYPPNVKGWDGGRAWINSSTLLGRANVIGRIIRDENTRFASGNLNEYFNRLDANSAPAIVDKLLELTLAVQPPQTVKEQLVEVINRNGDRSERIAEAIHALSTIPEFQVM